MEIVTWQDLVFGLGAWLIAGLWIDHRRRRRHVETTAVPPEELN